MKSSAVPETTRPAFSNTPPIRPAKGRSWRFKLIRTIGITDLLVVAITMIIAQILRFGFSDSSNIRNPQDVAYWLFGILMVLGWYLFLGWFKSRDVRVLGAGADEYKRVVTASLYFYGLIAIISYSFQLDIARGYIGIALPLGVILLLVARWILRQRLVRERAAGRSIRRVVILGNPSSVEHLASSFAEVPGAGYQAVAAILPGFRIQTPDGEAGLPIPVASVSREVEDIVRVLDEHDADALAITSGAHLRSQTVRQLGWELSERRISQIMAPALTDVAGPRIHAQPVAGTSLIHVSTPRLEGTEAFLKRAFDVLGAGMLLLLLSPLLLVVAICVKVNDPGPAFFHQERVGKDGARFKMHKFRSMVVDAEARLAHLTDRNEGAGVLFKMQNDPRITRVGAFIRRYSIDELPQLWNVLVGEMSMVGPRPPLPSEVAEYEKHVSRRLLVKPGITGLWQVSGRSNLSWDESVRLDLYYVENWSLLQDVLILAKTLKAVVGKDGAY